MAADGSPRTPDLGGRAGTKDVTGGDTRRS